MAEPIPEFRVSEGVRLSWEQEASSRNAVWAEAVAVLTRAARLTRTLAGGQVEGDDFPGFMASALSAVAANLGDVDAVVAGRPGSWEADLVSQLVTNTVGYSSALLWSFRTEPVVVPLNVAQLVEDSGCMPTFASLEDALPWPTEEDGFGPDDDWEVLRAAYVAVYGAFADAFTVAVGEAALTLPELADPAVGDGPPVLRVPVEVRVETDPDAAWSDVLENPDEYSCDPVVWRLWQLALERVALPHFTPQSVTE